MTYALVRSRRLDVELRARLDRDIDLDTFARATGLHPDLVRRFVALGLLEGVIDPAGELRFAPSQVATVARIQRLHAGLALNYTAIGLVLDLLDRIAELEAARYRPPRSDLPDRPDPPDPSGGSPWTRTA